MESMECNVKYHLLLKRHQDLMVAYRVLERQWEDQGVLIERYQRNMRRK